MKHKKCSTPHKHNSFIETIIPSHSFTTLQSRKPLKSIDKQGKTKFWSVAAICLITHFLRLYLSTYRPLHELPPPSSIRSISLKLIKHIKSFKAVLNCSYCKSIAIHHFWFSWSSLLRFYIWRGSGQHSCPNLRR